MRLTFTVSPRCLNHGAEGQSIMKLHQTYAPILGFNRSEKFYPMRVDDMLRYSSLCSAQHTQTITQVQPAQGSL